MNDNKTSAFRNAHAAIPGIHHLRLVWSAGLRLVGPGMSPWDRLHDRLLWLGFVVWLREDVQKEHVQNLPVPPRTSGEIAG